MNLLPYPVGQEISCCKRYYAADDTYYDNQQEVVCKPEHSGGGHRPRSRRNKNVSNVKSRRQSYCHRDGRHSALAAHPFAYRVNDHKAAVAEHGDGNNPANEHDCKLWMSFPKPRQNTLSKTQGRPALFKQQAYQGSQDDDQTYAGENR